MSAHGASCPSRGAPSSPLDTQHASLASGRPSMRLLPTLMLTIAPLAGFLIPPTCSETGHSRAQERACADGTVQEARRMLRIHTHRESGLFALPAEQGPCQLLVRLRRRPSAHTRHTFPARKVPSMPPRPIWACGACPCSSRRPPAASALAFFVRRHQRQALHVMSCNQPVAFGHERAAME